VVQAIGALAIVVSLAGLFVTVRQFNEQQRTNAEDQVNQQRQTTLDQYFDSMSDLILNHSLATSGSASTTAIAIARTATAVRNLDGARKGILVRFLWEAGLILGPSPVLDLHNVDLDGADFQNSNLYQAALSQLGLTGANFNGAHLNGADLSGSELIQANLVDADLTCWTQPGTPPGTQRVCTDLSGAYLMNADLTGANLTGADLAGAYLEGANLSGFAYDLTGVSLEKAHYNTRPETVENAQGQQLATMPTIWPEGFDPRAHGAICDDCTTP
jgi:uncharacterized protein YjbI with pentapeptide repeats